MREETVLVATMVARYLTSVPQPRPIQLATVNSEALTMASHPISLAAFPCQASFNSNITWKTTLSTVVSQICKAGPAQLKTLTLNLAKTTQEVSNEPMQTNWRIKTNNKMTIYSNTKLMKNFVQKSKFPYFCQMVAQFRQIISCLPRANLGKNRVKKL